jgi:hypothetical protein
MTRINMIAALSTLALVALNSAEPGAAPVANKKSLAEKLIDARNLVAKYEAELNSQALINNVEAGDTVSFNFGRAEKKKTLTGTVTGVRDINLGRQVKVSVGEGFDAETKVIFARDITANPTAEARANPAQVETPADGAIYFTAPETVDDALNAAA